MAPEVGHLIGLGDDYVDHIDANGQTSSKPLAGRTGTIMATKGTTKIDQPLITRLARQLTKLYKIPELCHVTYDITVVASQNEQLTETDSSDPDYVGRENIIETWGGSFDNWQVKLFRGGGRSGRCGAGPHVVDQRG